MKDGNLSYKTNPNLISKLNFLCFKNIAENFYYIFMEWGLSIILWTSVLWSQNGNLVFELFGSSLVRAISEGYICFLFLRKRCKKEDWCFYVLPKIDSRCSFATAGTEYWYLAWCKKLKCIHILTICRFCYSRANTILLFKRFTKAQSM